MKFFAEYNFIAGGYHELQIARERSACFVFIEDFDNQTITRTL